MSLNPYNTYYSRYMNGRDRMGEPQRNPSLQHIDFV